MWGPGAQGGFQNALATGLQLGGIVRQQTDARNERNALAAYAKDPNETNFGTLADVRPDLAIGFRQDQQAQQAAAAKQREQQLGTFRQLLVAAKDDPMRAFGAAQSMGIDVSRLPQPGTPEFEPWRQEQLFIVEAFSDPATSDQISRDIQRLGIDPSTPEGEAAARELVLFKYGKSVTDSSGRAAIEMPRIALPGGQQQPAPQAQAPQPSGETMSFEALQSTARTIGPQRAQGLMQKLVQGGVRIAVQTPEQARQLPSGTPILLPDGSLGVVP